MQVQPQNEKGKKISKGRLHLITSCSECHKRKQKCDQEQPCRHCARRFPPPACVYPAKEIATLQKATSATPLAQSWHSRQIQHVPDLENDVDSDLATYLYQDTQKQPDNFLEPLNVLNVGTVYQKLLSLMLAAPLPSTDAEPNANKNRIQIPNPDSQEDFRNHTEKLKWKVWQSTNGGISRTCFGISSVEPLHYLPIKPTVLNGELLQIFMKVLTKFVVSIDGNPSPNFYNDQWVPWSIKTPLLAQIAIYTASCYQSEAQKIPAGKSPIALRHKLKSISLLNETLRDPERSTTDEAIASVVYLTTNEWYWGFRQNVLAHKNGLKEMVRLRGGIEALEHDWLKKTVLLCDYHIACSFDIEPCFISNLGFSAANSILQQATLNMSTPLLQSGRSFASFSEHVSISKQTASILDDMRFLLQAVIIQTNLNPENIDSNDEQKLVTTATWIRNRIAILPETNNQKPATTQDYIYQSCRKAALIYCKAILEHIPLSQACTLQDLNQLWSSMWRVTLSKWKKIPGIFILVLLSANQAAQDTAHGRVLKSMLKSASFYVALENWEVIDESLAGFVKLQRWLRERRVLEQKVEPLGFRITDEQ